MLIALFYIFLCLSIISAVILLQKNHKHRQWRSKLESKFNRPISCKKTGNEIARTILDASRLTKLEVFQGLSSSDNVFKSKQGRYGIIRLSPEHYDHQSLRTLAVAAHECGHAINFNEESLRNRRLPLLRKCIDIIFGRRLSYLAISIYPCTVFHILFVLTIITVIKKNTVIWFFLFSAIPGLVSIAFTFLEEDGATRRGIKMLESNNLIIDSEKDFVKQYLNCNLLHYKINFICYLFWWNLIMSLFIINKLAEDFGSSVFAMLKFW